MTKKTRYFLFGSVAFVVLGLTAGLVGYYGGLPGLALGRAAGPDELRYVPKDAVVVAYANVRDVMGFEFRMRMKQLEPVQGEQGQQELRDALGIDIEHDVDHVVACLLADEGAAEKNGFILASGSFDKGRIETFVRGHGGVAQPYGGRTVFTHEGPVSETHQGHTATMTPALVFLQPDLVAFGSAPALKRAIDLEHTPGENLYANDTMMKMIGTVEGNAWAVGRFDAIAGSAKLPAQIAGQIPPITWFSASGRVNGGVSGTLTIEAKDADGAKNLRDVMNGFVALARMQAGSKPEMQTMLQSLQLGGEGNTVAVSFTLPASVLDTLTQKKGGVATEPRK